MMQFVTINKNNNIALLWFSVEEASNYLNVDKKTLYYRYNKGSYFHINEHDVYVFNYKIRFKNELDMYRTVKESLIFKQASIYKQEKINGSVRDLLHFISIGFLSVSYAKDFDKNAMAKKSIKLINSMIQLINKKSYSREFEMLSTIKNLIEEYEE